MNENDMFTEMLIEATESNEIEDAIGDLNDTPQDESSAFSYDELMARISELEELLSAREEKLAKARAEREYFCRVFPDVNPDLLPDEVNSQHESGVPLAAAYALYEKIKQNELRAAEEANIKNALSLNGSVSGSLGEAYFSADEVKKMSSDQVKKNLSGILRSMKHWGR